MFNIWVQWCWSWFNHVMRINKVDSVRLPSVLELLLLLATWQCDVALRSDMSHTLRIHERTFTMFALCVLAMVRNVAVLNGRVHHLLRRVLVLRGWRSNHSWEEVVHLAVGIEVSIRWWGVVVSRRVVRGQTFVTEFRDWRLDHVSSVWDRSLLGYHFFFHLLLGMQLDLHFFLV